MFSYRPDALKTSGPACSDALHAQWNDSSDESSGIFGLPFTLEEASLVVVPVPWDFMCSQGMGTASAPEHILAQSRFVELHDLKLGNIYERGIAMAETMPEIIALVEAVRSRLAVDTLSAEQLDSQSHRLNGYVQREIAHHLDCGRTTGLLGGDHSVSFGSIAAHHQRFPDIGILQIDAHADLRPSLDGMAWSHASIMWHVMESLQPVSLTQVGLRGICSVEHDYQRSNDRITVFSDYDIQRQLAESRSWISLCDEIIQSLPSDIYLTLDIDGLEHACCPHTGTPVPGGLSFSQVLTLLFRIRESGRSIRGFDLVEVGGHAQDALIAAHLLYPLCGLVKA